MKPLVIFVDDEPNLLSGLKRSLRRESTIWDAAFALGGQEALEIARDRTPQVIVSDMRMPIMDGAELLKIISTEFPETVRIILSGEAELDAIYNVAGMSHRFFLKPMDNAVLAGQLNTILAAVSANPELMRLAKFSCLPTPVETISALRQATGKDPFPVDDIRSLILGNIALSAKVLQIANSEYFGRPQPIHSVNRAIDYIGPDSLSALLAQSNLADHPDDDGIDIELRSLDARATALCGPDEVDDESARSANFLQFIPELCTLAAAEKNETANFTAQDAEFLMTIWGIPEDIVTRTMSLLAETSAPGRSVPEIPVAKPTAAILEPAQ